ncbi:MAG: hypothetical protein COT18_08060 [Elusimicrobia bacterium CG08_land_8_20_14_0_20_59_10]|nr:MAG: hypothetical protein COT18_08060 [Elusimicrobia bacterium CG08_land_8_20_14_0_20_59_10]
MSKMRIFVSSVRHELENERVSVAELVSIDSFLSRHCEAVLFEYLPASTDPAEKCYLAELDAADVYVGIIGSEYGTVQVPKIAARLRVTEQAVRKDMAKLQGLGLAEKRGFARATYYVLNERREAT